MHLLVPAVIVSVFPALVIVAGLQDATSYTIPNWISAALVVAFIPAAMAAGLTAPVLGLHLSVGARGLVAGMAMFAFGWIGGGDAKLFAAAGLWLGYPAAMTYLAVTGVVGGALALSLLGLRSMWLRPYVLSGPTWFSRLATPGENVPYGVAIAAGALAAFPVSGFVQGFPGLG